MDKKISNKFNGKKIVIEDKKKFYRFIGVFCLAVILIIVLSISSNKKIIIDNNTNISKFKAYVDNYMKNPTNGLVKLNF